MATPLRALDMIDRLSPGQSLVLALDSRTEPHLHPGEWAVVDETDREPVAGELYAIQYSSGPVRILEAVPRSSRSVGWNDVEVIWWLGDYCRPRSVAQLDAALNARQIVTTLDGPYRADGFAKSVRGRVVGVWSPQAAEPELTALPRRRA